MTALSIILIVVLALLVIFLGKEMLKKFGFMRDFVHNSNQLVSWSYQGGSQSGMRNIVLRSDNGRPFSALVGFGLNIPILGYSGFDYYGCVHSDEHGRRRDLDLSGQGRLRVPVLREHGSRAQPYHGDVHRD